MAALTPLIRGSRTRRLLGIIFGSILIAMTMLSGTVSAANVERLRDGGDYEFDAWDCGYRMHVVGTESYMLQWRTNKRMDGFTFFTNNYARTETWTGDDGRSFTFTANGLFKDVKQKPLGGTLY
jgi:hypothetical protein